MTVLALVTQQSTQRVWAIVRQEEKERPVLVLVDKLQRVIGQQIGLEAFGLDSRSVLDEFGIAEPATSSGNDTPVSEAGVRIFVVQRGLQLFQRFAARSE